MAKALSPAPGHLTGEGGPSAVVRDALVKLARGLPIDALA
jgi:hypothetical protein